MRSEKVYSNIQYPILNIQDSILLAPLTSHFSLLTSPQHLHQLRLIKRVLRIGTPARVPHDARFVQQNPPALLNHPERFGKAICPIGLTARVGEHGKWSLHFFRGKLGGRLPARPDHERGGSIPGDLVVEASQLDGVRETLLSRKLAHEVQQHALATAKIR